ncbi:MAG: extracellular solute-binding protein [Spirochaetia bacterium]|nr:extracellular solute-binding protein [Spirochaetia bacterium]
MKRFLLILAILLVSVSAVTAQGSPEVEPVKKLTFWTFGSESPELHAVMTQFKNTFKAETGVEVEWKMIGWGDYHQSNLLVLSSHEGPDVTQMGTTTVAQQVLAGAFAEVSDLYASLGGDQAFFKPMLATISPQSVEGTYAIPWFADPRGLIYRKDILDTLGLAVPASWDELVSVSQAIQDAGIMEYPIGIPGSAMAHDLYQTIDQAGGVIASYDGSSTISMIDSPESTAGIRFLTDLVTSHKVASPATAEYDKATLRAKFANGEIAFYYDSPQAFTYMQENAPEIVDGVAVAPAPAGPSGKASVFCGGSHLAVYEYSDNKELASQWISFLLRPEHVALWSKVYGNVPALLSASDLEGFDQQPWNSFISIAEQHGHHPESGPGGTLAKVDTIISHTILGAYLQKQYSEELVGTAIQEGKLVHQRMIDQFQ